MSPVQGKIEVQEEVKFIADMAGVKDPKHTENWQTLLWKQIGREVYRLQKRIYQATRRGDGPSYTARGVNDSDPCAEEPCAWKAGTHSSELSVG